MTGRASSIGAVAVLGIACLLLAGCVPVREVPTGGLSDTEVRMLLDRSIDNIWSSMALDDAKRPPDPAIVFIDQDDWAPTMASCMTDQGFVGYVGDESGLQLGNYSEREAESIAWYLCQVTYQSDPNDYGGLNGRQLEYMYDYNRDVLVPCLEAHGVEVGTPPDREAAVTVGGDSAGWNPYYSMYDTFDPSASAADRMIYDDCRPYPKGKPFDGIEIWPPGT